tara:strand:+ start:19474 stop:19722 length:249 start_codon:yes stop_codon:yes gene_type:complete
MLRHALENLVVGVCLLLLSTLPILFHLGLAALLGRYVAPNVGEAGLYLWVAYTVVYGLAVIFIGTRVAPEVRRVTRNWLRIR